MATFPDVREHVLRIKRSDANGTFILVNISPNGTEPLDLKILATEGENPYAVEIRHSKINKLKEGKNQAQDSEWEKILMGVLLQRVDHQADSAKDGKVEVTAAIGGSRLSIAFRKNVSGFTQRLGEITLLEDQNLELDTVKWTACAIERSEKLQNTISDLSAKYESATLVITQLQAQLDELVTAKKQHEDILLSKFRDLLNAKKLKIRDQQRLLAGAKVDPDHEDAVKAAMNHAKPRKATASRPMKRKARNSSTLNVGNRSSNESDAEEEDFAPLPTKDANGESDEAANTPEASEDATEDESDAENARRVDDQVPVESRAFPAEEMQLDSPPVARDLPFSKGNVDGGNREPMSVRDDPPKNPELDGEGEEVGNSGEETTDEEL